LPEKVVKVGKVVKVMGATWKITAAWTILSYRPDWRRAIRKHRHETGDDQPKKSRV